MTAPVMAFPPTDVAANRVHVGTFEGVNTNSAQAPFFASHAAQHSARFLPLSTVGCTPLAAQF